MAVKVLSVNEMMKGRIHIHTHEPHKKQRFAIG